MSIIQSITSSFFIRVYSDGLTVVMVQHQQESSAGEFAVCVSILTPEPQGHVSVTSEKQHSANSHPPYSPGDFLTLLVDIQELPPAFTDTVNLLFVFVFKIIVQAALWYSCKTEDIHIMWSFQWKRYKVSFYIQSVKRSPQMRQKEWAQGRKESQTWKTKSRHYVISLDVVGCLHFSFLSFTVRGRLFFGLVKL